MTVLEIFEAVGLEAARKFARRSGDGKVVAEFLQLQRELQERQANRLPRFITAGPRAPRVGKTAREGGRSAALARKAAKRAASEEVRAKMRGSSGGGGKKW